MPARQRTTKAKAAVAKVAAAVGPELKAVASTLAATPAHRAWRKAATVTVVAAVSVCALAGSLAAYHIAYANQIFLGISVDGVSLAGLTKEQAADALSDVWDKFGKQGIVLRVQGHSITLTRLVSSPTDPDLTYELMRFSPDQAAEQAYAIGRRGNWLWRLLEPMSALVSQTKVAAEASIDMEKVAQYIRDNIPGIEKPPVPAQLTLDLAGNMSVTPEQPGVLLATDLLERELMQRVASLSHDAVDMALRHVTPALTEQSVAAILPEARRILEQDTVITLKFEERTWEAQPDKWRAWLGARDSGGTAELGFTTEAALEYFDAVAEEVDQPAYDAKFEVQNGRVVAFQSSQPGREVDRAAMLKDAEAALLEGSSEPVKLAVAVTEPNITTAEANDLGIADLIGVGRSNFKGSPKNRRHNIKVGADSLNGLLVKPDETFSLLKALGAIDASTGYLPELVIKGNRTIPEYGGGLCQIGTTTFRAALGSGLPIVERRNHSYRVVYYEPAGTDATIYDPAPDFKFRNDTGHNVLIQTKIQGDELIFEFWGTEDGRTVEQTKPRIYNITAPPEAKIVETEDLEPGEKKCTEKPHSGADTEFTYTVAYADGRVEQEVFKSHYVPWQEVCLVGVPKGTLQPAEGGAPTEPAESQPDSGAQPVPPPAEPATP